MIYGISDLHLDVTGQKSMEVFGPAWEDYENRIKENWLRRVTSEDLVLIPGDISWALKLNEAYRDLIRIDKLPGKKIFLKGNHDYWWKSLNKIKQLGLESSYFLQNNSYFYGGYNIAGSRGWMPRDAADFKEKDEAIFKRELIRLELSLKTIKNQDETILILHYPPFDREGKTNEFIDLAKDYNVKTCLYGHLHSDGLSQVREGMIDGIEYYCLSADYIGFSPVLIKETVDKTNIL